MTVIAQRWAGLGGNVRGAVWILLAAFLMSAQSTLIKSLGTTMDSLEIVFFRGLFGVALILPFLTPIGWIHLSTRRPKLHLARAIAGVIAMGCGFYAFTKLSLADATAIAFTMPLFMIVLAVTALAEVVGWRRWTATLIGFAGVLVVVRPGMAGFQAASLIALVGSFSHAVVGVLLKKLASTETMASIMFYFSVTGTVVFLVPALLVWTTPSWSELGFLAVMSALGMSSQAAFFQACRVGEMTAVTPFDYSRLIFAVAFGYLLFDELPDAWTAGGAAIIVASTLFIARREARLARRAATRAEAPPEP
ncbi:MAG: DMT family transporter [Alphaproteobacteria bacterium]|nr:DMT family transporter [Alphaproteobacteria bacterium]